VGADLLQPLVVRCMLLQMGCVTVATQYEVLSTTITCICVNYRFDYIFSVIFVTYSCFTMNQLCPDESVLSQSLVVSSFITFVSQLISFVTTSISVIMCQ